MIGRRIAVSLVALGAVGAGSVAGAVVGVPGLSGASTSSHGAQTQAAGGNSSTSVPKGHRFAKRGTPQLDAAAKALNLTTQQLLQKLSDGKTTIADIAQQEHIDINTVIDAIAAADRQNIENFVHRPWPKPGAAFPGLGGPGNGTAGGLGRFGARGFGMGQGLDAVAKALGVSTDELKNDLKSGKTFAQIAKDKGVDINKVIDAMTGAADARIDQAVKNGHLSQQQGDAMKTRIRNGITNIVNGTFAGKGRGLFGRGAGMPGAFRPNTQPAGMGDGGNPPSFS